LLLVLVAVCALVWTFLPATLPSPPPSPEALPAASPPEGMSISALDTGSIASRAVLAYRGGAVGDKRTFAMTAILVRHPRGDLLIDAGFGRDVDTHVKAMPKLGQALTDYTKGRPAGAQLDEGGLPSSSLRGVLITHAHWDHVSGLDSLAGVPVWVNDAELAFIRGDSPHPALIRSFDALTYHTYRFEHGPYFGFAQSFDVWGDGSVVVVPAPGHTPGSIVVFLALPSGKRYALLGDLVWQLEGISLPAERPWLPRWLLDEDTAKVRESITRIAAIHKRHPQLQLLPAHDVRALAPLPRFPASVQ
jgi:glyoxylase-like metal-dependent hydrolase (beta-lactamase superfamily II)